MPRTYANYQVALKLLLKRGRSVLFLFQELTDARSFSDEKKS